MNLVESKKPSALVLNIYYGAVALHSWGTAEFDHYARKGKGRRFFPFPLISSEEESLPKPDKPGDKGRRLRDRGDSRAAGAGVGAGEVAGEGTGGGRWRRYLGLFRHGRRNAI